MEVFAEDPETGGFGLSPVVRTFIAQADGIVSVEVGGSVIETTTEHPFWIIDRGWVEAHGIVPGDVVRLLDGTTETVTRVSIDPTATPTIYNFEVSGVHTYYVGNDGVLVHNQSCPEGVPDSVRAFQVGTFEKLQELSQAGDDLALHHAGQKHVMQQIVPGYNKQLGPVIALPTAQHRAIPNLKGIYHGSARELLARDIRNLRNHTSAPNRNLQQLIELNRTMYPEAFLK